MLPKVRAYCAVGSIAMLVVSSVGPSAAMAAELISGRFPAAVCAALPDGGCAGAAAAGTAETPPASALAGGSPDATGSPTTSTGAGGTVAESASVPATTSGATTTATAPATAAHPAAAALPASKATSTVTPLPATSTSNSTASNRAGSSSTSPTASTPGTAVTTTGGTTAAQMFNWGTPSKAENFDAGLADWGVYNGQGHAGNGTRSPSAATVANGFLTIAGNAQGASGGMAWNFGAKYGRWEVRMRAPRADPDYHAVMLLWPDAENWPVGGEVDFAEMSDPTRQTTDTFLHYGASNSQVHGSVDIDATRWHNWAVEWTPTGIANYVDGVRWWSTADTSILPPGSMHLTLQLDNFRGTGLTPSQMDVDWAAFYPVQGSGVGVPPPDSAGTPVTPTTAPTTTTTPVVTTTTVPPTTKPVTTTTPPVTTTTTPPVTTTTAPPVTTTSATTTTPAPPPPSYAIPKAVAPPTTTVTPSTTVTPTTTPAAAPP
ncbi:MAG: glycoside hydrolase family 16 [Pseudonocardia sp.]|nr:glycoside hydrolase family 16 [Pseudonocardia sp.]MDT7616288.1 hypothetical protein [Pseudonocardiales bacterium]